MGIVEEEIDNHIKQIEDSDDKIFKAIEENCQIIPSYVVSKKLELAKEASLRFVLEVPLGYAYKLLLSPF